MFMQFLKQVVVPTLLIIFVLGCDDSGSETSFDPRRLTWSLEVIGSPDYQVLVNDIWASSSQDVFVTAQSGSVRNHKLFHFDGNEWVEIDLSEFGSSQVGFDIYGVIGFKSNNVWLSGERDYPNSAPPPNYLDSSLVIHFDGNSWREIAIDDRNSGLRSIGGTSSVNVLIGGYDGLAYRFDGAQVKKEAPYPFIGTQSKSIHLSKIVGGFSDVVYCIAQSSSPNQSILLKYSAGQWTGVDTTANVATSLWFSPSGRLYATFLGRGIYVSSGGEWELLHENGAASQVIAGFSDSNLFVGGQSGELYHFDGRSMHSLAQSFPTSVTLSGLFAINNEVFVIGHDGMKSYVLHGK